MQASLPKGVLSCELARTLARDFVLVFLSFLSFPTYVPPSFTALALLLAAGAFFTVVFLAGALGFFSTAFSSSASFSSFFSAGGNAGLFAVGATGFFLSRF